MQSMCLIVVPMELGRKRCLDESKEIIDLTRDEEDLRLEQVALIMEGSFTMFYMDGKELPTDVLANILYACQILEKTNSSSSSCMILARPPRTHIAAACMWIAAGMNSDRIGRHAAKTYSTIFSAMDPSITKKALHKAQRWVLMACDYRVWLRPFLDLDEDLSSRNLREIGFLTEQCFYPPSMATNKIHDVDLVQTFIDKDRNTRGRYKNYRHMQARLRWFCMDPVNFQRYAIIPPPPSPPPPPPETPALKRQKNKHEI